MPKSSFAPFAAVCDQNFTYVGQDLAPLDVLFTRTWHFCPSKVGGDAVKIELG